MAIPPGTHQLGPSNGALRVKTGRGGVAAKAGHDLVIEATEWAATIEATDDPAQTTASLTVDPTSLRVLEGTGGMTELGDDDKDNIRQTIDDEVLKRRSITFASSAVTATDAGLHVEGALTLNGSTEPLAFELVSDDDGTLSGTVTVTQSQWGMKPYSALFGTLKVLDDIEVAFEAKL